MEKKISFKGILELVKTSFKGFSENKVPKLSGSLAYCTVFSLGPLLIIIIGICGIFWGREAIEGKIYGQLENFMGHNTALQLQTEDHVPPILQDRFLRLYRLHEFQGRGIFQTMDAEF